MSSTPILTISRTVPFALAAELLTAIEVALETYGAQRIRIDPSSPSIAVLAELPPAPVPTAVADLVEVREAGVGPMS